MGKILINATSVTLHPLKQFKKTCVNTQRRKISQMQAVWICILSSKWFGEAFENTQFRLNSTHSLEVLSSQHTCRVRWNSVGMDMLGFRQCWWKQILRHHHTLKVSHLHLRSSASFLRMEIRIKWGRETVSNGDRYKTACIREKMPGRVKTK